VTRHRLRWVTVIVVAASVNVLLLVNFNTLRWPYLWPRPAVEIIVAGLVLALCLREYLTGIWLQRLVGLGMVFAGESYVLHSLSVTVQSFSLIALIHLIGVTGVFAVMVLSYFNQILPKDHKVAPALPRDLPYVAVIIPTYGEAADIVENTVAAVTQLHYAADRLYVLVSDDGRSEAISQMARRYEVDYIEGPRQDAKAGNLNSALAYLETAYPQASFVVTQDADEILDPAFLQKTLGYFEDDKVAFVQTPKEAIVPPRDPFGSRDRVFYDTVQPGRNGSNAAFSCGSGVIWRISAVKSIGGFSTWNLVEDLTTSYQLHCAGFRSEYHNEILSIGLAPDDVPGMLKQRGTWAVDTWRLFLFDNPWRRKSLGIRQRLQYLELGLFYVTSAVFTPLLIVTPVLSLATGIFLPIEGAALFPWMGFILAYYLVLARGYLARLLRMWQYWIGHGPTYAKAFWIATRARTTKPAYQVTRKTRVSGFYGYLLWPQFLFLFASTAVILRAIFAMPEANVMSRLSNIAVLLLLMTLMGGICQASFYGVSGKEVFFGTGDAARLVVQRATGFLSVPLRRRGLLPHSVPQSVPQSVPHSVTEHDDQGHPLRG
jgi:cellulose synthase (UDP-forming)